MDDDNRPGAITVLDPEECRALLASHHFGRLAVTVGGAPSIFPVNYVFEDPFIVVRTSDGTKMDAAPLSVVCFEIDEIDEAVGRGWSVVASGHAEEISHAVDEPSARLRRLPVIPMAAGQRERWLQIEVEAIDGRRIGPRSA